MDPITYDSTGRPTKVKLRQNTEKRSKFTWETGRLRSKQGSEVEFRYIANFLKKKSMLLIYAKPIGYHNDFTGRGKCKLSKRKVK